MNPAYKFIILGGVLGGVIGACAVYAPAIFDIVTPLALVLGIAAFFAMNHKDKESSECVQTPRKPRSSHITRL